MAELAQPGASWQSSQTLAQYKAIAWLRWRMFVNLARRTNSASEIAGKVLLYCVMLGFAVALTAGAFFGAWFFAGQGQFAGLTAVFWGIFCICQFLNINLGQPGTTFDPTQLIRFPLRMPDYVAIRLFFNLLSPANVMAMLMSLAAASGIIVAQPRLWLYSLIACTVFGLTNVLFSRMIFAWVDRWLSTRRAREIFTALIFVFSLGFQYINVSLNPAYGHRSHHSRQADRQKFNAMADNYRHAEPVLRYLPPNLTSAGLDSALHGQPGTFLIDTAACGAFGAIFLLVFALRIRTEFQGEALGDTAAVSSVPVPRQRTVSSPASHTADVAPSSDTGAFSSSLSALLLKEWLYIRRNVGLLYGLVAPLFFVLLFALRMGRSSMSSWLLPAAIAYSMLGIAPASYNSFGVDGTGAQIYFMAPVPLYRVFFAKNILHFATAGLEVLIVLGVMGYVSGLPAPATLVGLLLWAAGSLLLNTSLGNRRSIAAPKKINLQRMAGKQASQASALFSLGILLACAGYGILVLLLSTWYGLTWLPLPCFAAIGAAGFFVYRSSLRSLDAYALAHRDSLFEALGKS